MKIKNIIISSVLALACLLTFFVGSGIDVIAKSSSESEFARFEGYVFTRDVLGRVHCYSSDDKPVINQFKCDGTYTYYFQLDGTPMNDRLTYHPDGVHIIYFDGWGHEVFSEFANVKKSISNNDVNDFCFFDVFGYMYIDVLTYDKSGTKIYYANPYGVMEVNKWFQFSNSVTWAGGGIATDAAGLFGYAQYDGTLLCNQYTYDWEGRWCYLQANGAASYPTVAPAQASASGDNSSSGGGDSQGIGLEVYISRNGECYHSIRGCNGLNKASSVSAVSLDGAIALNKRPCSLCC